MYADDDPRENDDYAANLPDIEYIVPHDDDDWEDDPNEWS